MAPCCVPQIDPVIWECWQILPQNAPCLDTIRVGDEAALVITHHTIIDDVFDHRVVFNTRSGESTIPPLGERRRAVHANIIAAYRTAHSGRQPTTIHDLIPYAVTAEGKEFIQDLLAR